MALKQVLEVYELMDNPRVDGEASPTLASRCRRARY